MVDVEKIRSDIAAARNRLDSEKQNVAQKFSDIAAVESEDSVRLNKIPSSSQSRLRSGLYSGLEGRKRRAIALGVKSEIINKKKEIDAFKKELSDYEQGELKPFESEVKAREKELSDYDSYIFDLNVARNVYGSGLPASSLNTRQRAIYDSLVSDGDYKKFEALAASQVSTNDVSSLSNDKPLMTFASSQDLIKSNLSSKGLTRTEKVKDFTLLRDALSSSSKKIFSSSTSALVTPFSTSKVLLPNVKTTGSPLRMTKLDSLKSRGYNPSNKTFSSNNYFSQTSRPLNLKNFSSKSNNFLGSSGSRSKNNSKFWGL